MHFHVHRNIYFCGCSPEYDNTGTSFFCLEITYILTKRLDHVPTCLTVFHVVAFKSFCKVLVECSLHRNNLFQFVLHRVDVLFLEDFTIHSTLVCILRINIPATEYYVFQIRHRDNILVMEVFLVSTLANTNLVVLSHRANRLCKTFASHKYTCHKSCCHGSVSDNKNSQFAFCRLYIILFHYFRFLISLINMQRAKHLA